MSEEFKKVLDSVCSGRSAEISRTVEGKTYIRHFVPEERLILLGGGHISCVLTKMAALTGFAVTVADDRKEYANSDRFPDAAEVICDAFPEAIRKIAVRPSDFVCIMTREHQFDRTCLKSLLSGELWPHYIGMVGSGKRASALFKLLKEEGFDPERVDSIHAPVGLNINALTPAEIAVSILGEIILAKRPEKLHEEINAVLVQNTTDPELLRYLADTDEPKALILVVSSEGSTPVKSGAIMAMDKQGKGYGTIGGGLGEAQAMEKAKELIGTGSSCVMTVNMINDVSADAGMACGGTMRVLIEDMK